MELIGRGVLDTPPSRGTTASCVARPGRRPRQGVRMNVPTADHPSCESLVAGEQSGITMRPFKMQMTAPQSGLFFCLPALVEMTMT
jgi:hypothetical protein